MDDQKNRTIKVLFLVSGVENTNLSMDTKAGRFKSYFDKYGFSGKSKDKDVARLKELQRWFPEQILDLEFVPEHWDEYKMVCMPSYFKRTRLGEEWLAKAEEKHIFVAII